MAVIGLNIDLFIRIPKGFFPQQDNGRMNATILADQDSSFQSMQARLLRAVKIVQADPGVETVTGSTGGSGGGGSTINQARMNIQLKPLAERGASVYEIIDRLRPKLTAIRGATVSLQASQDVKIGARSSAALYQYTMRGDNLDDPARWGAPVLQALRKIPIISDATSDQQNSGLQSLVQYDRTTAARFGISPQLLDNVLYDAFGQRQVSTMYTSLNQYHVVMEAAPRFWQKRGFSQPDLRSGSWWIVGTTECVGAVRSRHRASGREPSGSLSRGYDFFQPGDWGRAGGRCGRHQRDDREDGAAGDDPLLIRRHRAGL